MRPIVTFTMCAPLMFAACSSREDPAANPAPVPATAAPSTRSAHLPTQAQMDAYLAEGPEPTLRKIALTDYWLNFKLMQATGVEKELGGEAQAIEALKALGEAYEKEVRDTTADVPRMIKMAFTGEGMSAGFLGMGAGSFVGLISGGSLSAMVTDMSDAQLAELNARGGFKDRSQHGAYDIQFAEDGAMTQAMEFDLTTDGVNGKVKMKSKMASCPDADGRVSVDIEIDSQMSVTDKPGTGGRIQTQFKYERYVDDDAKLIDTPDGAASNMRVRMGGYENFESQSVDIVTGNARGGQEIFENHGEQGYSIFRPEEVERTQGLLRATQFLHTLMAEAMLRGMGSQSGSPWEGGRCINLQVSSIPSNRKGLKPSTSFELEARPRVKGDGQPAGGTVTATLSGGSKLDPAGNKVKADAKFQYVGPEKKEESASIAFESRSKRGVGKATLEFDTKVAKAYDVAGGADEFHGTGLACDLGARFFIEGSGVTVRFEPSSAQGGRYSYSGNMSGFAVWGNGTYTVNYNGEVAASLTATGPGSVKTPKGTFTRNGSETYTLTPHQGECGS
jgi:hypothetical protein